MQRTSPAGAQQARLLLGPTAWGTAAGEGGSAGLTAADLAALMVGGRGPMAVPPDDAAKTANDLFAQVAS